MKQVDVFTFENSIESGARKLFESHNMRLIDTTDKDDIEHYFLLYFLADRDTPLYFEVDLKTAYDWVTRFFCIDDVYKKYLVEDMMQDIVLCMTKQIPLYCITEEK
jgi:hypothetical protein